MTEETPLTVREVIRAECGLTGDDDGTPWVVVKLETADGEHLFGWEDASFETFVKYLHEVQAQLAEVRKRNAGTR